MFLEKIKRKLALGSVFFLSEPRKIALDRWLRGREESQILQKADCVIISYGKSGRTWLRVMLSRFYQLKYNLPENSLIGLDNLHTINPDIPWIFFTHDNYLGFYRKRGFQKGLLPEKGGGAGTGS